MCSISRCCCCCLCSVTTNQKPFKIFQFYSHANTTHGNVVRVAPRPKNPPSYSYNLANSFPSTTFSANFYPNNSNFPNFTGVNSINYPNYHHPGDPVATAAPPITVTGTSASVNGIGNPMACNPFLAKGQPTAAQVANTLKTDRKPSAMEKKFNSLKSIGIRKSPQFYSMRLNKCKRHQSFTTEPQKILLINGSAANSMPYISQSQPSSHVKLKGYNQPLYENLTDSIQIHESSLQNESSFASVLLDEFNCEPERNSIYRSDSGISNSSYECITPVPAPRTNPRKCQSAPVYMNLPNSSNAAGSTGVGYHAMSRCSTSNTGGSKHKGKAGCHFVKHNSKCKSGQPTSGQVAEHGAFLNYEVCFTQCINP